MLKISSIKREAPDDGDWIDIPEWPGVRIRARSIDSRDYQIQRALMLQAVSRKLGRDPTPPELEPMLGRLVATYLLRGWEGLAGDDDKPLEFTPERGLDLLTDPAMRELELQVIWAATRVGAGEAQFVEAAIKN